jgi:hypothetical protein
MKTNSSNYEHTRVKFEIHNAQVEYDLFDESNAVAVELPLPEIFEQLEEEFDYDIVELGVALIDHLSHKKLTAFVCAEIMARFAERGSDSIVLTPRTLEEVTVLQEALEPVLERFPLLRTV